MPRRQWTDEEINTLVSMWPKASIISNRKHLAPHVLGNTRDGKTVTQKGLVGSQEQLHETHQLNPTRKTSTKRRETIAASTASTSLELGVRFERNGQLAAELYALSPARA